MRVTREPRKVLSRNCMNARCTLFTKSVSFFHLLLHFCNRPLRDRLGHVKASFHATREHALVHGIHVFAHRLGFRRKNTSHLLELVLEGILVRYRRWALAAHTPTATTFRRLLRSRTRRRSVSASPSFVSRAAFYHGETRCVTPNRGRRERRWDWKPRRLLPRRIQNSSVTHFQPKQPKKVKEIRQPARLRYPSPCTIPPWAPPRI